MVVNPEKAMATIDSLLRKIENISKKEYDGNKTVNEFGELVMEVKSLVRNSGIKNLKEQDWYIDYCEFSGWTKKGVPIHNWEEAFDGAELKKNTVGERYKFDMEHLKNILHGCKKEFEMIQGLHKSRYRAKNNQKEKKNVLPIIGITLSQLIIGIIGSVVSGVILYFILQ